MTYAIIVILVVWERLRVRAVRFHLFVVHWAPETLLTQNIYFSDDLASLLFWLNKDFYLKVALTVSLRLISTGTRRAPKVHPGAVDVRRPGEVHSINIIEGHASHLSTWIDPVHRPAAERYENHLDHQGKQATANASQIAPHHPAVLGSAGSLSA